MGGYEDSKFYGKLEVLCDLLHARKITQETFDNKLLEYLDDELGWSDGWLANHYDSTAEYLVEMLDEGNELDRPFEEMVDLAEKEIAIFRKHNDSFHADMFERWLNEAKEAYAEAV